MIRAPLLLTAFFFVRGGLARISLRGDRFALSSQIILIVFIFLLINSELYEEI